MNQFRIHTLGCSRLKPPLSLSLSLSLFAPHFHIQPNSAYCTYWLKATNYMKCSDGLLVCLFTFNMNECLDHLLVPLLLCLQRVFPIGLVSTPLASTCFSTYSSLSCLGAYENLYSLGHSLHSSLLVASFFGFAK